MAELLTAYALPSWPRLYVLPCWLACLLTAQAEEVLSFNPAFLRPGMNVDLSLYNQPHRLIPGWYNVDVYVNESLVDRQDIEIKAGRNGQPAYVCLKAALLLRYGVTTPAVSAAGQAAESCAPIEDLVTGSSSHFYLSELKLALSIPQAALQHDPRSYVAPSLWDQGMTAALLHYNFNGNRNQSDIGRSDQAYLSLDAGLNLGAWRWRHNAALAWHSDEGRSYTGLSTYLQRDISQWESQLTLGQANSSAALFDAFSFQGMQLASDERMLPQSMRGFAPLIQGTAKTNARVLISQAGRIVYETNVAPGNFIIKDLYPTGFGGDIDVSINEADGSKSRFTVPYAAVVQLLRPGAWRYSVLAGETRFAYVQQQAKLFQGTVQYGFNNTVTAYSGLQLSQPYAAVLGGLAFNTPLGAVSADLTQSRWRRDDGAQEGRSVRISYHKNIAATGSSVAASVSSTLSPGYVSLPQALGLPDHYEFGARVGSPRHRLSTSVQQNFGRWGQWTLSASLQSYWQRRENDVQFQVGYVKQFGHASFSLSANRARDNSGQAYNSVQLALTLPFDLGGNTQPARFSAQLASNAHDGTSRQAALTGQLGEDRRFSYALALRQAEQDSSVAWSGQYLAPQFIVNSQLSRGNQFHGLSLGLAGVLVAHPDGVTLSAYGSETMAIISAPGGAGAKVSGYTGLWLDADGRAVVAGLQPYQLTEVGINPEGASLDVQFDVTSKQVVPRAGAVVLVSYATQQGRALLRTIVREDGTALPFGSTVYDSTGAVVGIVAQGGQLYARLARKTSVLSAKWQEHSAQQCRIELGSEPIAFSQVTEVICKNFP